MAILTESDAHFDIHHELVLLAALCFAVAAWCELSELLTHCQGTQYRLMVGAHV